MADTDNARLIYEIQRRYGLAPKEVRGLYIWEMQVHPGHNMTATPAATGHNFQKGDIVHIEHEALIPDSKVLHDSNWIPECKSRFRLWHNGESVDSQVVRHASYDAEGKLKMNTVGQTVTIKPDTREGGPTQTQGVVEDARVLGT